MPFETRSSNQYSTTAGDMGVSLEARRCLRPQETSKVVKQRVLSPQANQSPKSQEKRSIESPKIGQPHLYQHHEKRQRAGNRLVFQPKSSNDTQKPQIGRKANKNDELVKHMSNLPGYLQRVEKGENLQEKALNFGVLDWERLETWKDKKPTQPRRDTNASSSGSSSSSKGGGSLPHSANVQSKSHIRHPKKQLDPPQQGFSHGRKQCRGKGIQDSETASSNTLDGQRKPPRRNKSSGRNHSELKFERGKSKDSDQKTPSEEEASLSGLRKHEFSHPSKDERSALNGVVAKRVEELQNRLGEQSSVVLLLPKHSPKESCSEIVRTSKPGTSFAGKLREANPESFSGGFSSEEVHSAELHSESGIRPHSLTHAQSTRHANYASCTFRHSNETTAIFSQGKCANENASSMKPSSEDQIDTSMRLDQEEVHSAEKGRHSSPNRRFSFSLGRIRRSLSFKEGSASPLSSSTYATVMSEASDPLSSEKVHSCPLPVRIETNTGSDLRRHRLNSAQSMELYDDDSCLFTCRNEEPYTPSKANATRISQQLDQEAVKGRHPSHNRRFSFGLGRLSRSFSFKEGSMVPQLSSTYATVKSGPVRSEESDSLDYANRNKTNLHSRARSSPLRRLIDPLFKGSVTNPHHSTENLNLTSEVISSSEYQDKKHETSTIKAFLQLKVKNGLPLFKLVANNNHDIFVGVKKLTAAEKDDASWIYTFYSVSEIKKKSGGWMSQGQKGKSHGFGYNVVGEVKVFNSLYPDSTVQSLKDQFAVREFVLYSADQESPELELAAIIVKTPFGNSSDDRNQRNKGKESSGKGFDGTTVILPGGVHGLPNKGVPSPLLQRWKSGGSCDCGGWDVGCKLRILANKDPSPDQFDLFSQVRESDNRPIFSLTPFEKGIYSVEFSPSISLLQAFSICVTVISSQKSFDFSEANDQSEAKLLQVEIPANYVPPPPPSPVGRA